jgi:hypothetical protein
VKACLVVVVMAGLLPALVLAQSGMDVPDAIPIHPDVPTILVLPEAVEGVWVIGHGALMVQGVGKEVYVRPRPGTPADVEALVEVKTRTLHRFFLVRVVARAGDATREVVVSAAPAAVCVDQPGRDAAPAPPAAAGPAASAPASPPVPAPAEPAASPPAGAPVPAPAGPAPSQPAPTTVPEDEHAAAAASRFEFSAHALVGMGFTGLDIAGYRPATALQHHYALGLRLEGALREHWLSLEADISGESPAGPMVFKRSPESEREVTGARLRGELGLRASAGTTWIPSAYAGIGLQVHLRRLMETSPSQGPGAITAMARGAVLALGLGLQYRARSTLLGLEFQVRQGGPDDYFSVVAFLTLGRLLEQGE